MLTNADLIRQRLLNLQIAECNFSKPEELVYHLGAMQSQDWNMAKWAIGLRMPHLKETDIEKAFNEGKILRTHVMRPTWHFVHPKDIRWLIQLTGPRVEAFNKTYYRKHGVDDKLVKRGKDIILKALEGKNFLTREQLNEELRKKKSNDNNFQEMLIIMKMELEGLICSGPRIGKQFSYALMDERVPKSKSYTNEEALGMLTKKYFSTRGPATLKDYSWWSGLSMKEVREGIEMQKSIFTKESVDKTDYYFIPNNDKLTAKHQTTFILPDYDEYGISYKDRSAYLPKIDTPINTYHYFIVNGVAGGTWHKNVKGKSFVIETTPLQPLSKAKATEVEKAIQRYKEFFNSKL